MRPESLVLASLLTLAGRDPLLPDWVHVPVPRQESRPRWCGNYSDSWYLELSVGGGLKLLKQGRAQAPSVEDPIPFAIVPGDDRRGVRHVARLDSGWLVGFDAGEFGGGLWWFDSEGAPGIRVRPPADAPVNPKDPYKADNVRGFGRIDGDLVVLMGLDHLYGRSGRVFRVQANADVSLVPWTALDGCPRAWAIDGRSLIVLTDSSVYELTSAAEARVAHTFKDDLRGLYPTSIVLSEDRQLYIGARRYVVRLTPVGGGGYRESWWVPRACLHFRLTDKCECRAGK